MGRGDPEGRPSDGGGVKIRPHQGIAVNIRRMARPVRRGVWHCKRAGGILSQKVYGREGCPSLWNTMDTTLDEATAVPEILRLPAAGSAIPGSAPPMLFQKASVLRILCGQISRLSTDREDQADLLQDASFRLCRSEDEHPVYTESWHIGGCLDYLQNKRKLGRSIDSPKR